MQTVHASEIGWNSLIQGLLGTTTQGSGRLRGLSWLKRRPGG